MASHTSYRDSVKYRSLRSSVSECQIPLYTPHTSHTHTHTPHPPTPTHRHTPTPPTHTHIPHPPTHRHTHKGLPSYTLTKVVWTKVILQQQKLFAHLSIWIKKLVHFCLNFIAKKAGLGTAFLSVLNASFFCVLLKNATFF